MLAVREILGLWLLGVPKKQIAGQLGFDVPGPVRCSHLPSHEDAGGRGNMNGVETAPGEAERFRWWGLEAANRPVAMSDTNYTPAEQFHVPGGRVYEGEIGEVIYKRSAAMARVLYTTPHENTAFPEGDDRRGRGRDFATWVFSEEPGLAEGLFCCGLELIIDARLEPDASVGLHMHRETEEVYYLLEGALTMTTVMRNGGERTLSLGPGDAHGVRLGESHYGRAGARGCRFIAVAFRRR